jgi:hypothetical protein
VAETGQPYAFTGDDPLNATDPLGLRPSGLWIKGGKYYSHYVKDAHYLPTRGNRFYIPQRVKGHPEVTFNKDNDPVDSKNNVWEWDGSTRAHGGPHYDVQHPITSAHTNVTEDGNVIGEDNFPNKTNLGTPYDPSSDTAGGSGGDEGGGAFEDPAGILGMVFSTCGPGGLLSNQPSICNNYGGRGRPNANGTWNQ